MTEQRKKLGWIIIFAAIATGVALAICAFAVSGFKFVGLVTALCVACAGTVAGCYVLSEGYRPKAVATLAGTLVLVFAVGLVCGFTAEVTDKQLLLLLGVIGGAGCLAYGVFIVWYLVKHFDKLEIADSDERLKAIRWRVGYCSYHILFALLLVGALVLLFNDYVVAGGICLVISTLSVISNAVIGKILSNKM